MAEWKSLTLGDLIPADDVETILVSVEAAVTVMESAAVTLDGIAVLMKAQMLAFIDPVRETLIQLKTTIENFIADFEATGGYFLVIRPKLLPEFETRSVVVEGIQTTLPEWWPLDQTMDELLFQASDSFYDYGDVQRPNFTTDASVGGIVIVFSLITPLPQDLLELIEGVEYFFGLPFLSEIKRILQIMADSAQSAFEDNIVTPPPGACSITSVDLSNPNAPAVSVSTPELFPPSGQVWIRNPGVKTDVGAWRSPTPVTYLSKTGSTLYLDNLEASFQFDPDASPNASTPQVNDWAIYAEDFRPIQHWTLWSRPPDWTKLASLGQAFGIVYEIIGGLKRIIALIDVGLSAFDAIDRLVELVKERIEQLSAIVDQIREIIDNLPLALLNTGIHYTVIPEGTGTDGFVSEMLAATDRPEIEEGAITFGLVMVAGAAGVEAFTRFFPF